MSTKELDKTRDDGFYCAIGYVLGYLNRTGDCCSTMYDKIVEAVDEAKLISYARKNGEMRFTGLDKYLRYKKTGVIA